MKLKRTTEFDGEALRIKTTHTADPVIARAKMGREGKPLSPEMAYAGTIPGPLVDQWMKEAGLTMDQWDEVRALMKQKLQDSNYAYLRGDDRLYRKTSRAT